MAGVALIFGRNYFGLLDVCQKTNRKQLANRELDHPDPPTQLDKTCFVFREMREFLRLGPLLATNHSFGYLSILPESSKCHIKDVSREPKAIGEPTSGTKPKVKGITDPVERSLVKEMDDAKNEYLSSLSNMLGVALLQSKTASKELAIKYLSRVGDSSASRALYNLGVAYEKGIYADDSKTQPDLNMAFEYYERASDMNHKCATYNLALYYLYGKGPVAKDLVKGTELLEKANSLGFKGLSQAVSHFKHLIGKEGSGQLPSGSQAAELKSGHYLTVTNNNIGLKEAEKKGLRSVSSAPDLASFASRSQEPARGSRSKFWDYDNHGSLSSSHNSSESDLVSGVAV